MVFALVRAYRVALSFYPEAFRQRYADEMRLDFEDGLQEAVAASAQAALLFLCRQTADLCSSLLREWIRSTRAATAAATTIVTAVLWGLALRPWSWKGTIQLRDRGTMTTAPVDVWELSLIAIAVLMPIVAVIVLAPRLGQRVPAHRRRQR